MEQSLKSALRVSESYNPSANSVLFHGDCLTLLDEIPNESVQLVVTSPPYNIGKEYEGNLGFNDYIIKQKEVIDKCIQKLTPTGSICWQVGNYVHNGSIIPLDIKLYPIFEELGLKLRNRIIWHFGHGLHASKRFSGRYEVILWFTKSDQYVFNLDAIRVPQKYPGKKHFKGAKQGELSCNPLGKNPSDIWDIPNVKSNHVEKTIHPCQFPVELIERLVLSLTNPEDWVLDPFMGVGSTAIAALMHGRKAIGAEIKGDYIEVARARIREAERGLLRIRPMDRPVYDPNEKAPATPPSVVSIGKNSQLDLLANTAFDLETESA